ncbi:MAG: ACP phosphodiesterase [Chitinophagaceae bacterium]
MNYLGHAYLSFSYPSVLAGNMISDYVKGKKKFDYPSDVQVGINLHRYIDTFTDSHPATKTARQVFKADYGLYSGAFVDVLYDHFLANDPAEFTEPSLAQFAQQTYRQLDNFTGLFPEKFGRMFPYMKQHDWLYHYRELGGMQRSFEGLAHRSAYITESATAYKLFIDNYDMLQQCYNGFFSEIKQYTWNTLQSFLAEEGNEQKPEQ